MRLRVLLQEDSLQFFKEERHDDSVYNVYLKKVRYHTPDVGCATAAAAPAAATGANHPQPNPPRDESNSLFYLNIAASTARLMRAHACDVHRC